MRLRYLIPITILIAVALLPMPQSTSAQGGSETCEQFVRQAITDLGTNCANLEANTACYGFASASAKFVSGNSGTFSAVGDRTELTSLASVKTSPLGLTDGLWGMSLFSVEANPADPKGEQVVYLAVGDVEVENAVTPNIDSAGNLVIDATSLAPMQAFYLRAGTDAPECSGALPSMLYVQGPKDQSVTIKVNGQEVQIGSTVLFQVLPPGNVLRLITLYGMATLNPGSANELLIPPGFFSTILLGEPQNLGLDGLANDQESAASGWSDPQPLTKADLDQLAVLNDLPANTMNYGAGVPSLAQASGVGQPTPQFIFTDPAALALARAACLAGRLPPEICRYLF